MHDPRQPKHEWESFTTAVLLLLAVLVCVYTAYQIRRDWGCEAAGGTVVVVPGGMRCLDAKALEP